MCESRFSNIYLPSGSVPSPHMMLSVLMGGKRKEYTASINYYTNLYV